MAVALISVCAEKVFGWLTSFTNSAGIRLSHKNYGGGGAALAINFGAAAHGGGAGVYFRVTCPVKLCTLKSAYEATLLLSSRESASIFIRFYGASSGKTENGVTVVQGHRN